jgi:hypothetical protein
MKSKPKASMPVSAGQCSRASEKTLVNFTSEGGTSGWKEIFLQALATTPSVKSACAAAGVSRMTAYRYRDIDEDFARDWQSAIRHSVDDLEAVAFKLAAEGDTGLIQFLLRCHRPEIYKDTSRRELTGADGRPLTGKIIFLPSKESGDE